MERQSRPYNIRCINHGRYQVVGPDGKTVCDWADYSMATLIADLLCYRWRCLSGDQNEVYDVKAEFNSKWPDAPTRS